jgi:hypothetical protein
MFLLFIKKELKILKINDPNPKPQIIIPDTIPLFYG